jgi:hypothetical protein
MKDVDTMKPCFVCGKQAPTAWDAVAVLDKWVEINGVVAVGRSRFDGMRERLQWASVDEDENGAHPICALQWAIEAEGYGTRYPNVGIGDVGL